MKILINIYIPALGKSMEVFVPLDSPVYEVFELIRKSLVQLAQARLDLGDDMLLCYQDSGKIVDINHFVYELGLKNGSKLMLI